MILTNIYIYLKLTGKVRVKRLKGKDGWKRSGTKEGERWRERGNDEAHCRKAHSVLLSGSVMFVCEMGSSCGSALLFWDMKSSLLFYRVKLARQMSDEDGKAEMLTLHVQLVLSRHIASLTNMSQRSCNELRAAHQEPRMYHSASLLSSPCFQIGDRTTVWLLISFYPIYKL